MGKIPNMEEAQKLLGEYNQDAFHLKHANIVSGVMGWLRPCRVSSGNWTSEEPIEHA